MATLIAPTDPPADSGADLVWTAALAGGMKFANSGRETVLVKNDSAAAITVTITSVPCSHGRTADKVVNVPAGTIVAIDLLEPNLYNQPSGADAGQVICTPSAVATISFAVLA